MGAGGGGGVLHSAQGTTQFVDHKLTRIIQKELQSLIKYSVILIIAFLFLCMPATAPLPPPPRSDRESYLAPENFFKNVKRHAKNGRSVSLIPARLPSVKMVGH